MKKFYKYIYIYININEILEIFLSSNQKKSEIQNSNDVVLQNPLIIGLDIPREKLYERRNKRVDIMMQNGLLEEVKALYNSGLNPENSNAMKVLKSH